MSCYAYGDLRLTGSFTWLAYSQACSKATVFAGRFLVWYVLRSAVTCSFPPPHKPQLNALQSEDVSWQRIKSIVDLGPPLVSDRKNLRLEDETDDWIHWRSGGEIHPHPWQLIANSTKRSDRILLVPCPKICQERCFSTRYRWTNKAGDAPKFLIYRYLKLIQRLRIISTFEAGVLLEVPSYTTRAKIIKNSERHHIRKDPNSKAPQ